MVKESLAVLLVCIGSATAPKQALKTEAAGKQLVSATARPMSRA